MKVEVLISLWIFGICLASEGCQVSVDCGDKEGRSLCYEKRCRRDVPCNKDNDCFFYGAADVSQSYPHPKCYLNKKVDTPPGYGICMLREYAGGLPRIPGGDVVDTKETREVDMEMKDFDEGAYRII